MSDLKYKNLEELKAYRKNCENTISYHSGKVGGHKERLKRIDYYINKIETEQRNIDREENPNETSS